jgi:Animal haem peroxidase
MPRFRHGCPFHNSDVSSETVVSTTTTNTSAAAQPATKETRFGFLFPELQKKAFRLTRSPDTVKNLIALGDAMDDTSGTIALDSTLPSVFTYFGQLIAHDITWEKGTRDMMSVEEVHPWKRALVESLVNKRSGSLDLDCIYGDASFEIPVDKAKGTMTIDEVAELTGIPPNKSKLNDVHRTPHIPTGDTGRNPCIGDPRNDANTIISQLHVAFLHAHNKLVEDGNSFADARTKLVQLYQTIILEDYLPRLTLPNVLDELRKQPDRFNKGFMPLEFSAAAFRFGHTMIRAFYDLNRNFRNGSRLGLRELFDMPPLSYHHLPGSWVIEWEHFIDGGSNLAHRISTQMVKPLSVLPESPDNPFKKAKGLAERDLLRGYIFGLPTGQAIAEALDLEKEIIAPADFERLVPTAQWNVLKQYEFLEKTPLWFYILAEAVREKERHPENDYLGPVGSHLVAGVLMGLLFKGTNSILQHGNSQLGSTLKDLFRLAGVLSDNPQNA